MAVKVKGNRGVPKAGPKKRRAKAEADADAIRAAVEEHSKRGKVKSSRRAGKVNTFKYKDASAKPVVKMSDSVWAPYLRDKHEFIEFMDELPYDLKPLAAKLFKAQCVHEWEVSGTRTPLDPAESRVWVICKHCWYSGEQLGKLSMLRLEWATYCPDGFDMWEWMDMFIKDKSLWRFVIEEAEAHLVEFALGRLEAT